MSQEVDLLLLALDQAYGRKSWHGTNLKGALRGMTLEAASRRPGRGRPSIHELVVHLAAHFNSSPSFMMKRKGSRA
jgi:hypothetical protein